MIDGGVGHFRQVSERQKADREIGKQRRLFSKLPLYLGKAKNQPPNTLPSAVTEDNVNKTFSSSFKKREVLKLMLAFLIAVGITIFIIYKIISWLNAWN